MLTKIFCYQSFYLKFIAKLILNFYLLLTWKLSVGKMSENNVCQRSTLRQNYLSTERNCKLMVFRLIRMNTQSNNDNEEIPLRRKLIIQSIHSQIYLFWWSIVVCSAKIRYRIFQINTKFKNIVILKNNAINLKDYFPTNICLFKSIK